jgi:hypothetical protein
VSGVATEERDWARFDQSFETVAIEAITSPPAAVQNYFSDKSSAREDADDTIWFQEDDAEVFVKRTQAIFV